MIEEKIHKIVEDWFLMEPALFVIWCTHKLVKNEKLAVPMRSGRQMIEFNPERMIDWNENEIAERLKFEVLRILLGHPYMRKPYMARKGVLGLASDITLKSLYKSSSTLPIPSDLEYVNGKCFEEYYALVKKYVEQRESETISPPYEIDGGLLDDGGGGLDEDANSTKSSSVPEDSEEDYRNGSGTDEALKPNANDFYENSKNTEGDDNELKKHDGYNDKNKSSLSQVDSEGDTEGGSNDNNPTENGQVMLFLQKIESGVYRKAQEPFTLAICTDGTVTLRSNLLLPYEVRQALSTTEALTENGNVLLYTDDLLCSVEPPVKENISGMHINDILKAVGSDLRILY